MPRSRFLSLSPLPPAMKTHQSSNIGASYNPSPTPIRKRASFSMQSVNYNNGYDSSSEIAAATSYAAADNASMPLKQQYADPTNTPAALVIQNKRHRHVSSYLNSDYETGEANGGNIAGTAHAQDHAEGDGAKNNEVNDKVFKAAIVCMFLSYQQLLAFSCHRCSRAKTCSCNKMRLTEKIETKNIQRQRKMTSLIGTLLQRIILLRPMSQSSWKHENGAAS